MNRERKAWTELRDRLFSAARGLETLLDDGRAPRSAEAADPPEFAAIVEGVRDDLARFLRDSPPSPSAAAARPPEDAALASEAADRDRWTRDDLQTLFDTAPVGVAVMTKDGIITECNAALGRILRLTRSELLTGQHRDRTYLNADGTPMLPSTYASAQAIASGQPVLDVDTGVVLESGEPLWVRVSAAPLPPSGDRAVIITQDVTESRRAGEALRQSQEKYRTLIEHMSQGIYYRSADGTLLDANPAALRMFGLSLEELRRPGSEAGAWGLLREDGERLSIDCWPSLVALRTGAPVVDMTLGVVNPRLGRTIWVVFNAVPQFRPGDPRPYEVFVTMHDITERIDAEAERRRSIRFTRGIIDGLSAHIAVLDQLGTILDVNEAWREFGRQNGIATDLDWIGVNYFEICRTAHGESSEGAREFLDGAHRLLAGDGQTVGLEYPCHSPEEERWFTARVTRFPTPGEPMLVVAHENITARKSAEAALREREALMRSLFTHSLAGILLTAPDGRIFAANDAACRMLGRSEEELRRVGRPGLVDERDPRLRGFLRERDRTGHAQGEVNFVRPDGSRISAEVASESFETAQGPRTCVVLNDVSQRKLAESRVREFSRRVLSIREEEKQSLSSDLHHEVGSFSLGISSRLAAAEEDVSAGRTAEALDSIRGCRRLLDESVARLKAVAVELRPPDLDLVGLPAALRQHVARLTSDAHLRLRLIDATGGVPIPPAVETVLFRVAQECLNNIVRHAEARSARVRLSIGGGNARLLVADDGRGIASTDLADHAGKHLGLRAIEEMTAALGGTLVVKSSVGRGTRIAVSIPMKDASA